MQLFLGIGEINMKSVIQRVISANVKINNKIVGQIGRGFVVFLGVSDNDTNDTAKYLAKKITSLRVFSDENNKMNLSLKDIKGELLIISQFTLFANCSNGNRPSFIGAGNPKHANELYEYFIQECKNLDINVQHGIFGADMQVDLINDGPVTILLDSN